AGGALPAGGQEGADRRRRHAQHLRAGHGAGLARDGDRLGRQRSRGDPAGAGGSRHRHRADGHHDAGDGRAGDHAADPPPAARARAAHGRGDRQGDEGRPPEVHRGRRLGLPVQAGGPGLHAHRAAGLAMPLSALFD
ncbi:conserved hypothetical protein, partial [Ricinus communis]